MTTKMIASVRRPVAHSAGPAASQTANSIASFSGV
jgi:hypothetical protein